MREQEEACFFKRLNFWLYTHVGSVQFMYQQLHFATVWQSTCLVVLKYGRVISLMILNQDFKKNLSRKSGKKENKINYWTYSSESVCHVNI